MGSGSASVKGDTLLAGFARSEYRALATASRGHWVNRGGRSAKVLEIVGQGSLADFLGDFVVYRSLSPIDRRLPALEQLRRPLRLPPSGLPRKAESAYARAVSEMLGAANRLQTGTEDLSAVIMIGDTEHNDGGAFRNICAALSCPGGAFIGDEDDEPPRLEAKTDEDRRILFLANRWCLIDRFEDKLAGAGIHIGSGTAVIVDIDKTALGARGRNHRPIDAARVAAVMSTAAEILGNEIDKDLVVAAYRHFNVPIFHAFTGDNQDYLAYLGLIVGGGWSSLETLDEEITSGAVPTFESLLARVTDGQDALPPRLRSVHIEVSAAVAAGDPTPFKGFRRAEYHETARRMVPADDDPDVGALIETGITITHEVQAKALEWRDRGALLFGLSDKPDEASFPSPDLAAEGFLPLHRTPAWVVGEASPDRSV